jgi:hypothetical protein
MRHRYAFASAYLACFVATELVYTVLDPNAQARLIAWASTSWPAGDQAATWPTAMPIR